MLDSILLWVVVGVFVFTEPLVYLYMILEEKRLPDRSENV